MFLLQILRIENPDTHEELNLDDIKKEVAKKEKAAEDKEAPAPAPAKETAASTKEDEPKGDDGKPSWGGSKSFKDKLTESKPEAEAEVLQAGAPAPVEKVAKEEVAEPKVSKSSIEGELHYVAAIKPAC